MDTNLLIWAIFKIIWYVEICIRHQQAFELMGLSLWEIHNLGTSTQRPTLGHSCNTVTIFCSVLPKTMTGPPPELKYCGLSKRRKTYNKAEGRGCCWVATGSGMAWHDLSGHPPNSLLRITMTKLSVDLRGCFLLPAWRKLVGLESLAEASCLQICLFIPWNVYSQFEGIPFFYLGKTRTSELERSCSPVFQ